MAVFDSKANFTRNPPPPFVLDDFPDGERQQAPRLDWLITATLALAVFIIVGICVTPLCLLVIKVLG